MNKSPIMYSLYIYIWNRIKCPFLRCWFINSNNRSNNKWYDTLYCGFSIATDFIQSAFDIWWAARSMCKLFDRQLVRLSYIGLRLRFARYTKSLNLSKPHGSMVIAILDVIGKHFIYNYEYIAICNIHFGFRGTKPHCSITGLDDNFCYTFQVYALKLDSGAFVSILTSPVIHVNIYI